MDNELSPELEAALILVAVARTAEVQAISDAMTAVGAAIDDLDMRLFPGGLNPTLNSLKQSVEGVRAALKREYGTTYVSSVTGPPLG